MKLLQIKIRDFKGIHSLNIDLDGMNMNICGGNGTGKTTIYDAFLWLLFDRDSTNRCEFAVKPRGRSGEEIHHLKTCVEGSVWHSGRTVKLKKSFVEKWTKKRGESDRRFTGHETEHSVDGVPCTRGEYQAAISAMIDEDTFRLITSPGYFNNALSWQERRNKLFTLAGYMEGDDEMLALLPEFFSVREIVRGRGIQEAKRTVLFSIKKLKEELQAIPVRTDEIERSMPQPEEWEKFEHKRACVREKLEETERSLACVQELAKAYAQRLKRMETLKHKMRTREEALKREAGRERAEADYELENIKMHLARVKRQTEEARAEALGAKRETGFLKEELNALFDELGETRKTAINPAKQPEICALCGQALPREQVLKKEELQRKAFEEDRERKIMKLLARTEEIARRIERMEVKEAEAKKRAEEYRAEEAGLEKRNGCLRAAAAREIPKIELHKDEEYIQIAQMIEEEANAPAADLDEDVHKLLKQKKSLSDQIFGIERKLAARTQIEMAQKRMTELSGEEKNLLCEIAKKEAVLADLEKFTVYKCSLMENKINSMFKTAKWKLFDIQINGGISECCECLIGGVPYADANSAARINTGLEIIDVFSRVNGVSAPIFIDNRESINELFTVSTQVVNLIVTGEKTLRIEPDIPAQLD